MEIFRKETTWKAYIKRAKGINNGNKTEVKKGAKNKR
jgi:hypothetical protein